MFSNSSGFRSPTRLAVVAAGAEAGAAWLVIRTPSMT
jgi:hypothetical protein